MSLLIVAMAAPLVAGLLLVLRRLVYLLRPNEHHQRVPRPPFALDWIPFLGHTLGLADEDAFWLRMTARYGPMFRVTALGDTRIFVTGLPITQHLYKITRAVNYAPLRSRYQHLVFGSSRGLAYADAWGDSLHKQHHVAMQSGSLAPILRKYGQLLEEEWDRLVDEAGEDGRVYDLESTIFRIIYNASSKAMCGPTFPVASTLESFLTFDKQFPLLTLSKLPSFALASAVRARTRILDKLCAWVASLSEDDQQQLAPHFAYIFDGAKTYDWSVEDMSTLFLGEIWAAQGNAPFAAIWTVAEILRHPELLQELNDEVAGVVRSLDPPTIGTLLQLPQPDLLARLPKINACLQESLRFYSTSASVRVILEDTVLPASLFNSGIGRENGMVVKKGETVVCVTRAAHLDPMGEWGETADRWDWTRMREGKKGPMLPFGGGVSMCEGRYFASGELLTFLACFVSMADVQLVPGADDLKVDKTRVGLGIQHPQGSMKALIRRRK